MDDDLSNTMRSGVPAAGPVDADDAAARAAGAGSTTVRGTGRVTSVLRVAPSCVQGEVLGGSPGPGGPVLGAGSRGSPVTSAVVTSTEGSDVTHASTREGSEVTHATRNYNLRPRKVKFVKS